MFYVFIIIFLDLMNLQEKIGNIVVLHRCDVLGLPDACKLTGAAQRTSVFIRREAPFGLFVLTTDAGGG